MSIINLKKNTTMKKIIYFLLLFLFQQSFAQVFLNFTTTGTQARSGCI